MTDSADRILKGDMLIALGVRISSNRNICSANEGLKLEFFFLARMHWPVLWLLSLASMVATITLNLPNGKAILNPI